MTNAAEDPVHRSRPGDDDTGVVERTPDLGFFWKAIVGGAAVSGIAAAIVT